MDAPTPRRISTLDGLLNAADLGLSNYQKADWFAGAELKGDLLLMPNVEAMQAAVRLFGDRMLAVLPTLRWMVNPPQLKAVAKRSAYKPGHEPSDYPKGDLL